MSTHRSRRIDRATAEQLLAGARSQASGTPGASDTSELMDSYGTPGRHEALAGLLAAAAAPAGKDELSGEPEALAMFRTARLTPSAVPVPAPVPVPVSPRRSLPTPATLLGAKVAAAVLAAALGGVAVAAGTGNLPAILGGAPEHGLPAASPTPDTLLAEAPSAGESPAPPPGASLRSSAAVPADLAELCLAFARAPGPRPEEVLAEQRFTALVAAAGGRSGVRDYCAPVQGGEPEPSASAPATVPTRNPRAATPQHPGKPDPSRRPVTPGPSAGQHGPRTRPPGPPSTAPSPPPPRRNDPPGHPPGANP